jgi:hypothetical protein
MNILVSIVHYWNPAGSGTHQSLRKDPAPRVNALQQQLLSLRRLGQFQSLLDMSSRLVYRTNDFYRNVIDIKVVNDGVHNVLGMLAPEYSSCYDDVVVDSEDPKMLGFSAQKILAANLDKNYDLYCYLEDDLLILDPTFFSKLSWFSQVMDSRFILLPHRFEISQNPSIVDRFYIDGPLGDSEVRPLIPNPLPEFFIDSFGCSIPFSSPSNPHSGCFFLTHKQLSRWVGQPWWQDRDISFVSPLESAATLGITKTFELLKPSFSHSSWFEIQHYGTCFHSLISNV